MEISSWPVIGNTIEECHICPLTKDKCVGDCMWDVDISNKGTTTRTCALNAIALKLNEVSD